MASPPRRRQSGGQGKEHRGGVGGEGGVSRGPGGGGGAAAGEEEDMTINTRFAMAGGFQAALLSRPLPRQPFCLPRSPQLLTRACLFFLFPTHLLAFLPIPTFFPPFPSSPPADVARMFDMSPPGPTPAPSSPAATACHADPPAAPGSGPAAGSPVGEGKRGGGDAFSFSIFDDSVGVGGGSCAKEEGGGNEDGGGRGRGKKKGTTPAFPIFEEEQGGRRGSRGGRTSSTLPSVPACPPSSFPIFSEAGEGGMKNGRLAKPLSFGIYEEGERGSPARPTSSG